MMKWGIKGGESIQTGQSMLRLSVAMKALCSPEAGGGGCCSGGWSLSLPDDQYPTGQQATATSCS